MTPTQWQYHINAWQSSDKSKHSYCRDQGLSYSRFLYWRNKAAPAQTDTTVSEDTLLPVKITETEPVIDCLGVVEFPMAPNFLFAAKRCYRVYRNFCRRNQCDCRLMRQFGFTDSRSTLESKSMAKSFWWPIPLIKTPPRVSSISLSSLIPTLSVKYL